MGSHCVFWMLVQLLNYICKRRTHEFVRNVVTHFQHDLTHTYFLCNVSAVPSDVQVTIACDAVLNAPSAYKKQELESWDEEIQVSRHARSLRQLDNGVRIPPR